MPLLELINVHKHFGGLQVVHNLSLVVNSGEIVSLIGPNGAGKTTVFNLITGLYAPNEATSGSKAPACSGCSPTRSRAAALPAHSRPCACS